MAQIYRATLVPTKLELLAPWVSRQAWAGDVGDGSSLEMLGAYRFDDPAGQVGIETMVLRHGGTLLQVPMSYRDAPLADAEPHLIGTLEHSVLGTRWVYDGCHDPVYARALAEAILLAGTGAEELVETEDGPVRREPTARVAGSGSVEQVDLPATTARVTQLGDRAVLTVPGLELQVLRRLGGPVDLPATLVGTWAGGAGVLAGARVVHPISDWYGQLHSALDDKMGLEVFELTPQRIVGRMPVAGNTQPMGLWHGGASCVLAETLASIGSVAHGMPDRVAVGVDLNATHHRAVRSGWVTGTATALRLGRNVAMYEVVLVDDGGNRVCTARVTCQLVAARRPGSQDQATNETTGPVDG